MDKLNRDQMIELVGRLQRGEVDEEHSAEAIETLKRSSGHPRVSDLIFYPEGPELTAEQIVDKALAYRPIQL